METLSRNGLRRPFCNSLKKKAFVKGLSVFEKYSRMEVTFVGDSL